MSNCKLITLIIIYLLTPLSCLAEQSNVIKASEAPFFVNQSVVACGKVVQTKKFRKGVYLNLDKRYPSQTLTLLLWTNKINDFTIKHGAIDNLVNKDICVKGEITEYNGSLQTIIKNEDYLKIIH